MVLNLIGCSPAPDGSSSTADGSPSTADGSPSTADGSPSTADDSPSTADDSPSTADGSPSTADDSPSSTAPAASQDASPNTSSGDGPAGGVREIGLADESSAAAVPVAKRHPNERPLRSFSGTGLEGERLTISQFIGKRLTIFFFNPEVDEADFAAGRRGSCFGVQREEQFQPRRRRTRIVAFQDERVRQAKGNHLPGLRRFQWPNREPSSDCADPVGIYSFDDEGYLDFGIGYFAKEVPRPGRSCRGSAAGKATPARTGHRLGGRTRYAPNGADVQHQSARPERTVRVGEPFGQAHRTDLLSPYLPPLPRRHGFFQGTTRQTSRRQTARDRRRLGRPIGQAPCVPC